MMLDAEIKLIVIIVGIAVIFLIRAIVMEVRNNRR
jgi:hypothetical protein